MPELTQRTLGLVRDVLFEMEPEETLIASERSNFWKQELFDAGFPQAFIDVAKSYDFRWTDIIPSLYTAKFGEQNVHFSTLIPPTLCEQFLKKLVVLAVNASLDTPLGERLRESLSDDGVDTNASVQTETPAELTKLPDKPSLLRDLAVQIQGGKLVSLVFVDLDNFKQVNDQHGHSEGDKCLVEVIANVSGAILGKGKIYRVGGDEFCVVLPNFSCSEAAATAERVRLGVDGLSPFGGTTKVTTSIGVAASDAKGVTSPESLVEAADEAMYVSKWTTKNRVTIWPASDAERQLAKDNRERAKSFQRLNVLEEQVQSLRAQQDQLATQETRKEQERQGKQEVRDKLAAFLTEAQRIKNSLEYNNPASVYEKTDWERRVEQYLTENLDQSSAVRFRSPKHQVTAYPTGINSPMRGPWAEVTAKMAMLDDFISELRD
jgi:diguanylate cyclase (GGDEF)-like protein